MNVPFVRSWLKEHSSAYSTAVLALALNLPLLVLVLSRHLEGVSPGSLAGLYSLLVFIGYYALVLFVVITLVFLLAPFSRRLAVVLSGTLLTVSIFYLLLNGFVHSIYKFHLDAFWLGYLFSNSDGLGVQSSTFVTAGAVLLIIGVLQWMLFRIASHIRHRPGFVTGFAVAAFLAFFASQAIHIVAYYKNDSRITSITPQLPFYYPLTSHKHAVRYAGLIPASPPMGGSGDPGASASIHYPLRAPTCAQPAGRRPPNILMLVLESWRYDMMDSVVSPHIAALARKSTECLLHYSSGNATPTGIFGLFYGIDPTYWTAVKANSETIDNPVLIDVLGAQGYAFGIYADSHFERHKIKDTIFRGIQVHEDFAGSTPDAKDADLTRRLLAFAAEQSRAKRPFMGFAFYKSTHYSYYYPKEFARFLPTQKLNLALVSKERDPRLYLNDYRNSILYDDALIGGLLAGLDSLGILDQTVVVITSDHGEEFNDNHANYWGHTSNFTQYQTRVPMIMYVPWRKPQRITEVTCHADVPTTLLEEALGCDANPRDYSTGRDLFGPLGTPRPIVIAGYVNHAFVIDDNVYAVLPMYVQRYKVSNIRAGAPPPRPDMVREAMEETHRFYEAPAGSRPPDRSGLVSGRR